MRADRAAAGRGADAHGGDPPRAVPGKPGGAAGLWRRGRAGRGGFQNGPLAGERLFPPRREGTVLETGGQLPVPLADALSEAAREGVRRLPEVREHLPREGHHDAARQAAHRPQGLHPLLLLPGVLPEGRDAGWPERTDADFGEIKKRKPAHRHSPVSVRQYCAEKSDNQMAWVRQMNACRVQAEAIAEDEYLEGTIVKILGIEVYDAVT